MRTDDLRAHITLGPSILMLLACKPIPNLVEVGNERARSVFTIPPASPSLPRLFNILLQAAIGDAAAIDASFDIRVHTKNNGGETFKKRIIESKGSENSIFCYNISIEEAIKIKRSKSIAKT